MKTALLISTYNWPDALDLVLKSILNQTTLPDEILIADDGSSNETKALIDRFRNEINVPICHVWQEDVGFRKSKILNKAISQTNADYIIQIDGDCILHKKFISDHLDSVQKGFYLYGSRVNILPEYVDEVIEKKTTDFNFFSNEIKNRSRSLSISFLSKWYKPHYGISKKFRGCNVSFWRKDLIDINGYNEDFEGWGREDSDLVIRMGNNGVKAKRLRYAGILYHIFHKSNSKSNLELNNKIQKETIDKGIIKITNGINQYLKK
ncbi:glycosyltransferase family 2 protein [Flavobacterium praedii]|uniref:glycosyltransferase family 2 protein n=1 Tax=Flavobacterium praedii TaxID=3002900 RepID=UPI002481AAF1|nr:glycosyltransferase family 2 protein [Flavobacterium praedii]